MLISLCTETTYTSVPLAASGKVCCEACPRGLVASGAGLSGGCEGGLTLKEWYLLAAASGLEA